MLILAGLLVLLVAGRVIAKSVTNQKQTQKVEQKQTEITETTQSTLQPEKTQQTAPESVTRPIVGVEQYRYLVQVYYPAEEVDNALTIMRAESKGDPTAISPTDDHGLMQLNCGFVGSKGPGGWCTWFGVTREQMKDPETNIRLSAEVWRRKDWSQWTTSYLLSGA